MEGLFSFFNQNRFVVEHIQRYPQLCIGYFYIVDGKAALLNGAESFAVAGN